MAQLVTEDVALHVEVDGEGTPVSILAHGLMNSCRELAALTPLVPGTKVRFCFRGHGHSSSPERGYRFADFARDVSAVADEYEATIGFGTSLGAGAIGHLLTKVPDRFDKLIFLLPAGLDQPFQYKQRMLHTAGLLDGRSTEEAIEAITSDPGRAQGYLEYPWLRDFDRQNLQELNTVGVPRAIREVIEDWPVPDRELLRKVTAPTLLICIEGDDIHPAELGRIMHDLLPSSELLMFESEIALFQAIPSLVQRVGAFLTGND